MHPDTLRDLERIKSAEQRIAALREEVRNVKAACHHNDVEVAYIETMGFDFTPATLCVVCGSPHYPPSEEQKRELYERHCEDLEIEFTEEDFQKKKNGFNLRSVGVA